MTRFTAVLALVLVSLTSPARAETAAECAARAAELLAPMVSNPADLDRRQAQGIGLGVAGVIVTYVGANRNFFPQVADRLSILSYGLLSIAGSLALIVSANDDADRTVDALRAFRGTTDYRCLQVELGNRRAEAFLADLISGWEFPRLARKYLSAAQRAEMESVFVPESQ